MSVAVGWGRAALRLPLRGDAAMAGRSGSGGNASVRSGDSASGNGIMRRILACLGRGVLLGTAISVGGCSSLNSLGRTFFGGPAASQAPQVLTGFIGGVAADEPRAATIARDVLAHGGTAADAAVALGFALSVTLPSRASLGAGGACLAYAPPAKGPGQGRPEAILFTSLPSQAAGGDRPASLPMLARGLYALYARYGSRPFGELVIPAEQMARFGIPVSRAFAQDLALVGGPLLADPNARAIFGPNGTPLAEGQRLVQPDLGATLAQMRVAGVGDLYQGQLAAGWWTPRGWRADRSTRAICAAHCPGWRARSTWRRAMTTRPFCRRRPMAGWRRWRHSRPCGATPATRRPPPRGRCRWPPFGVPAAAIRSRSRTPPLRRRRCRRCRPRPASSCSIAAAMRSLARSA